MAVDHRSIQLYIFQCTYPNVGTSWEDDPDAVKNAVKAALANVSGMTYVTIKVSNVRNSTRKELEIHCDDVKLNGSNNLTSTQADDLRSDIITELDLIANFTYQRVDLVNNLFHEDKTSGWNGSI